LNKKDTAFVYTLSSRNKMVQQTLRSIATLKHYVPENQIKIYYTPPYNKEDEKALEETGAQVIKKENQTEAFNVSRSLPERNYGEKINLCSLEEENVVFLDCDTIIGNNIWDLLEGDFEFSARFEHFENWEELFEKHNEDYIEGMPNAGFLIFKNNFHKKIKDNWTEYVKKDLDFQLGKLRHDEQYALALAISSANANIHRMSEKHHVLEYRGEKIPNGYVYHVEQAAGSNMINLVKNYINRIKQLKI